MKLFIYSFSALKIYYSISRLFISFQLFYFFFKIALEIAVLLDTKFFIFFYRKFLSDVMAYASGVMKNIVFVEL